MINKKTAGFVILVLTVSLAYAPLAFAANGSDVLPAGQGAAAGSNANFPNIDSVDKVLKVMDNITNWMFTVFMVLAVIFILLAAYKYLFSGGGEEVAKAHKMILYAAVAIAVALLARGVIHVVASLLTV